MLRRITDLGGTASFDEVQRHFADHPTTPIATAKMGGTLTSVQAVQRHVAPTGASRLLQRDGRAWLLVPPAIEHGLEDLLFRVQQGQPVGQVQPSRSLRTGHTIPRTPCEFSHVLRTMLESAGHALAR
ncbi:hypothetical protein AB0P37_34330 [Streptomyces antimycoticus]|uniref:hypothetical protein n=1 Tax=Streptomyces antimycoticus TaxID=68175 RepID=UPI0034320C64